MPQGKKIARLVMILNIEAYNHQVFAFVNLAIMISLLLDKHVIRILLFAIIHVLLVSVLHYKIV